MLGLFGNKLSADNMNSCRRWEKFLKQVQTLFSQKQKLFFQSFSAFFESTQNTGHFQNEYQIHRLNISEVIDP